MIDKPISKVFPNLILALAPFPALCICATATHILGPSASILTHFLKSNQSINLSTSYIISPSWVTCGTSSSTHSAHMALISQDLMYTDWNRLQPITRPNVHTLTAPPANHKPNAHTLRCLQPITRLYVHTLRPPPANHKPNVHTPRRLLPITNLLYTRWDCLQATRSSLDDFLPISKELGSL